MDKKLLNEVFEDLIKKDKTYFETGFWELDELLHMQEGGALITIGARPSMGKTTFLYSLAEKLAKKEKKILFFSLEIPQNHVISRLLCQNAEIDYIKIRKNCLNQEESESIISALNEMSKWDLHIDDTAAPDISYIEDKIKKVKPDVVFIDYLQLIRGNNSSDRYKEVTDIVKNLKRISEENKIVIFLNSQLSRACETRYDKYPMLSDLRDSGAIENLSDVVIFIYRPEYYNQKDKDGELYVKGEAHIIVAKNRFGCCGIVYMYFKSQIPKFFSGRSKLDDIF